MSSASQGPTCAACGQLLPAGQRDCGSCGASASRQEVILALGFAISRFQQWAKTGIVSREASEAIVKQCTEQRNALIVLAGKGDPPPSDAAIVSRDECWNCGTAIKPEHHHCFHCGVPVNQPDVRTRQYWLYVCYLIKLHHGASHLPLAQAHACMNDAKSKIAALRTRLEKDRVVIPEAVAAVMPPVVRTPAAPAAAACGQQEPPKVSSAAAASSPPTGESRASAASGAAPGTFGIPKLRKPILEILLDPRTIQWMLGLGGTLLVVGLVIWLATLGLFKNALVVATLMGIGNAALMLIGWATIRYSRYQTAGRAVTLLACLIMPLNLWFYHVQGLVTLEGHLWVAALVCCVLYFASALVLRDPLFVYVLNGGIAMTGLLWLASIGEFWGVAYPACLLIVLAMIGIHIERAFAEGRGPFSRRRFGRAFFRSGHALLAAGLLLVFGAQLTGDWLFKPLFEPLYQRLQFQPPVVVTERWGQFLALALVLAGAYAYLYSDIIVHRARVYAYLAVFTLLWAEILVIELVALKVTTEAVIIALALTGLVVNLFQPRFLQRWEKSAAPGAKTDGLAITALSFVRAGPPLGLFLSTVPVLLGLALHLRATYKPLHDSWLHLSGEPYSITWTYVIAMLVTAVSCRVGAHLYRHTVPWLSSTYFFGTAAATLTGVAGVLYVEGVRTWDTMAPIMMVVPIVYLIAARLYRGHTQENPLVWVAHSATAVMIVAVLAAAMHLTPEHVVEPIRGDTLNLLLAAFFGEAALFYALAVGFRKQGINVYLSTAMACGALWQLLQYWQVGAEYYTLVFALLGLGILVGYRLAVLEWTGLMDAAFQCANALMSLSFVAAALITLSRLGSQPMQIHWPLLFLLIALTVLSLIAAWLVQHAGWRRWYVVMTITEAGLAFVTLQVLSILTLWQKIEIFSVVVGVALLVIGHIGWYREDDRQSDLVSFCLLVGSLLVGIPLLIAVLIYRFEPRFSTPNELAMLTLGIMLLVSGLILQLRATTIVGAVMLLVYLLSLVLFANMLETVQIAAIWLTIGGVVILGFGIVLSIYRDRLLSLPERVLRREGIFRVLRWR